MHSRLEKNARKAEIDLVIRTAVAEDTGLPANSAEVVVSSLVLCTVVDPAAAVAEARRILKPRGRLIVVEHVRGRGRLLRAIQSFVARPWKWLFEGCELDRETANTIRGEGFSSVNIEERTMMTAFVPVNSFAFGTAVK